MDMSYWAYAIDPSGSAVILQEGESVEDAKTIAQQMRRGFVSRTGCLRASERSAKAWCDKHGLTIVGCYPI